MHRMNVRVQIKPGKVDEAAKLLREEVRPTAASCRGFMQNFLIVDASNSRLATLSVWESETDAKAICKDEGVCTRQPSQSWNPCWQALQTHGGARSLL